MSTVCIAIDRNTSSSSLQVSNLLPSLTAKHRKLSDSYKQLSIHTAYQRRSTAGLHHQMLNLSCHHSSQRYQIQISLSYIELVLKDVPPFQYRSPLHKRQYKLPLHYWAHSHPVAHRQSQGLIVSVQSHCYLEILRLICHSLSLMKTLARQQGFCSKQHDTNTSYCNTGFNLFCSSVADQNTTLTPQSLKYLYHTPLQAI